MLTYIWDSPKVHITLCNFEPLANDSAKLTSLNLSSPLFLEVHDWNEKILHIFGADPSASCSYRGSRTL